MFPELFEIPFLGITLKSYGLMIALGFLAGLWTAGRRAERMGVRSETLSDLAVWLIVGGIVGARVFYVLQYWGDFRDRPWTVLAIWQGGLVFYGGFLAAVAAGFWFVARRNLDPWPIADCVAPSVAMAYAFGRIGCFLNGCCWGFAVSHDHPLGIAFPAAGQGGSASPLFRAQLAQGLVLPGDAWTHPVFPAQLLSALAALVLFFVLDWRVGHRRYVGQAFFWLLMGYALYRFGVEFLRDDTQRWAGFTIAQWISPVVFAGSLAWSRWIASRRV